MLHNMQPFEQLEFPFAASEIYTFVPSPDKKGRNPSLRKYAHVRDDEIQQFKFLIDKGYQTRDIVKLTKRSHTALHHNLSEYDRVRMMINRCKKNAKLLFAIMEFKFHKEGFLIKNLPECRQFLKRMSRFVRVAKKQAITGKRACNITVWDIFEMYKSQDGLCSLTGIAMRVDAPKVGNAIDPYLMSIDRIDSNRGYVKGNVRLVIWAINLGMSAWGESVYRDVASIYCRHQGIV